MDIFEYWKWAKGVSDKWAAFKLLFGAIFVDVSYTIILTFFLWILLKTLDLKILSKISVFVGVILTLSRLLDFF